LTEGEPPPPADTQLRWARVLLGVGFLFSGVALLGHLLAGISLPLLLGLTGALLTAVVAAAWLRLPADSRRLLWRVIVRGLAVALVATVLYDVSRAALALIDPSPFDPFAAWPIFGWLLLGRDAGADFALAAGVAFHVLNGLSFGLAYLLVFGRLALRSRRLALASGVGWGLFLEAFQVTLYPGWLSIAAYREFVTISALGHVVYGATLGLLGRRVLGGLDSIAEEPLDG